MRIIRNASIFIAIVVLATFIFLFLTNFLTVDTKYKCTGSIDNTPMDVYISLTEYSKLNPWSKSYGSMFLEVPNESLHYYSAIDDIGTQLHIYEDYYMKDLKGNLSTLSNTLALKIPTYGFFDGRCQKL